MEEEKKAEKKVKKEKKPADPAKRKKKRRIIILSAVGVFILYVIISNVVAANTPMQIMTTAAERGDIRQTINTSGNVTSNEEKTYFPSECEDRQCERRGRRCCEKGRCPDQL